MNHVKIFKGWTPEMPTTDTTAVQNISTETGTSAVQNIRNWYNCGTKHFCQTGVVWWK